MNKICVYAICKNELRFVEQWYNSVKEADYVVVLDTGSTDGTFEKLKELGVTVEQKIFDPFRFDEARNASLELIPDDYDLKVFVDLDEYFDLGWSDKLRNLEFPRDKQCTVLFMLERNGKRWDVERCTNNLVKSFHYPIHEEYVIDKDHVKIDLYNEIKLNHVPEEEAEIGKNKSDFYLKLSKLRYEEELKVEGTKNFYSYLWYGFLLLKQENYNEAIKILNELLACNETNIDSYYLDYTYYLLDWCYDKIGDENAKLLNLFKKYTLKPNDVLLCTKIAQILYKKDIVFSRDFLTNNLNNFVSNGNTELMAAYYNLLDLTHYYTGKKKEALEYAKKAVALSPKNELYKNNLLIVEIALGYGE